MLGIFLIYFIGKKFAELAELFNRHKWGYAILGVVSYYAGTIIFGVIFFLCLDIFASQNIGNVNEYLINLISVSFGILSCWAVYKLLEANWKKEVKLNSDNYDLLDNDLL